MTVFKNQIAVNSTKIKKLQIYRYQTKPLIPNHGQRRKRIDWPYILSEEEKVFTPSPGEGHYSRHLLLGIEAPTWMLGRRRRHVVDDILKNIPGLSFPLLIEN